MDEKTTANVQAMLTEADKARLKRVAARYGVSLSTLVRTLLLDFLRGEP